MATSLELILNQILQAEMTDHLSAGPGNEPMTERATATGATSVPEEIACREELLKKIREAKQTIEKRAQKQYEAEEAI